MKFFQRPAFIAFCTVAAFNEDYAAAKMPLNIAASGSGDFHEKAVKWNFCCAWFFTPNGRCWQSGKDRASIRTRG